MNADCNKFLNRALLGASFLVLIFFIKELKKSGIIEGLIGTNYDALLMLWVVTSGISSIILFLPYLNCLVKHMKQ